MDQGDEIGNEQRAEREEQVPWRDFLEQERCEGEERQIIVGPTQRAEKGNGGD